MPKRPRKKADGEGNSKKAPKKTATPKNPKPDIKSAISVNPAYDAMPDVVEDPAAVFKLAFLDMQVKAEVHALAIVAQEYEKRVNALNNERTSQLNQAKANVKEAQKKLNEHRAQIEETYGLALRSYTYDDETGVLKKQDILHAEEKEEAKKAAEEGSSAASAASSDTLH